MSQGKQDERFFNPTTRVFSAFLAMIKLQYFHKYLIFLHLLARY